MPRSEPLELADLRRDEVHAWQRIHEHVQKAAAVYRQALGEEWDDAVQEAEIKVLRAIRQESFVDTGLRTFVWRVTRNTCLDQLRRRRLRTTRPLESWMEPQAPRPHSPTRSALRAEQRDQISLLLRVLPEEGRELLVQLAEGRSYGELAEQYGLSPGALRVRAHRYRQEARARFARMTSPIVGAAQRLFLEHGVAATPLHRVAEASGVTMDELSSLFPDKTELLWAIGHRVLTGADGVRLREVDFARPVRITDDPRRRVYMATRITSRMFARGLADFEAMVLDAARAAPAYRPLLGRMLTLRGWIGSSLVTELTRGIKLPRDRGLRSLARAATVIDSAANFRRLRDGRGWSGEEIRQWKQREIERLVFG